MQEHASRLIGLYKCNDMPQSLSVGFDNSVKIDVVVSQIL